MPERKKILFPDLIWAMTSRAFVNLASNKPRMAHGLVALVLAGNL
jgi:hypothetical protein